MPASKGRGSALGIAGLLLLSLAYVAPGHPSAGSSLGLDALLHVGLFAVVGFSWSRLAGRGALATTALLLIACLLEVLQWWRGQYPDLEYADIAWNMLGCLIGRWLSTVLVRDRSAET